MSEKKPLSPARKRANKKWNDANLAIKYDRISLVIPKGRKETIAALAKDSGQSVNGFINSLLQDAAGLTAEDWRQG